MLTEIATSSDRGGGWGSFPFMWHWWQWRDTIQWVYCPPLSYLSPEGAFFKSYCTHNKLHISSFVYLRVKHLQWIFLLVQYIYNLLQILFQTSRLGSPQLEATFDTIIEVFMFLDKNGNGKLNKKDMVKALNETSPWEKSPSHITKSRFSIKCFTGYALNFILFLFFIAKFLVLVWSSSVFLLFSL